MPHLLSLTTAKALASPVETTLQRLLDEYGLPQEGNLLASLSQLSDCLDHHNLQCLPKIGQGGLNDLRVISSGAAGSLQQVILEIENHETDNVEFKSSLRLDRKRLEHDPGRPIQEYRSENVLMSALKTIAGFANAGGGMT